MFQWAVHLIRKHYFNLFNINLEITIYYGRKLRRTKEPLDESESGEWKSWLKTQHSEN